MRSKAVLVEADEEYASDEPWVVLKRKIWLVTLAIEITIEFLVQKNVEFCYQSFGRCETMNNFKGHSTSKFPYLTNVVKYFPKVENLQI